MTDIFTDPANNQQNEILTPTQIELVEQARKDLKENPDSFLDWEEARKTLKVGLR